MNDDTMRIALCDDDAGDRSLLAELTRKVAVQEEISCELVLYDSSTALLRAIEAGTVYDTLLLDVVMPELDGMQLAAALRRQQNNTNIIFVSSNREMALMGYEVAAVRFLGKPAQEDKLREALRFCCQAGKNRAELTLTTGKGSRKVNLEDVVYVETWGRGVRVVLREGQEEVGMKISELEKLLPQDRFVLCHRTVLVNLAYVQYLRYCELEMKTGAVLPVSKYRQSVIRDKLMNYLAE